MAQTDPSTFAQTVAVKFRQALPGYEVTVVDDFTLKIGKNDQPIEQREQVNLDRIDDYCARAPDACSAQMEAFVSRTAALIATPVFVPTVAKLRAILRPVAYEAKIAQLAASEREELVSKPYAADLVMMCYFDAPTAIKPAFKSDLAKIGVDPARAFDICLGNTRAVLPKLPTTPPVASQDTGAIGYLYNHAIDASYMLMHDDWKPLVIKMGGRLLVSAPDADLVMYAEDKGPFAVDALMQLTKQAYGRARRPISDKVFRWTSVGWEVAVP